MNPSRRHSAAGCGTGVNLNCNRLPRGKNHNWIISRTEYFGWQYQADYWQIPENTLYHPV